MTPDTKDLVDVLNDKGLTYIADLVSTAGSTDVDTLEEFINERTSVEITDLNQLKDLTPEQVVELQKLETDYKREMLQLTIEAVKLSTADAQNARDVMMNMMQHNNQTHAKFLYWCGSSILIITALYLFAITFLKVPAENIRYADTVLGFLMGNCMGAVINFFFGSSLPTIGNIAQNLKKK